MNDSIQLKGYVKIELKDETGKILETRENHNVITITGKNALAAFLANPSGSFMPYVGLGTSTTPALNTDSALGNEVTGSASGYHRASGVLSNTTNTWQNVAVFEVTNGVGVITEVGLFSNFFAGTMFAHQVFAGITKNVNNTLTVTWQIIFN